MHTMHERQGANREYGFLRGGEGSAYYAWALYCALHGLPVSQPLPGQAAATPAAGPQAGPAGGAQPGAAPAEAQPQAGAAPAQQQQPQQQQPQDGAAVLQGLPVEVSSGWQQVLGLLTGSRDSIRNSQQWFMACAPYAAGMAEMMLQVGACSPVCCLFASLPRSSTIKWIGGVCSSRGTTQHTPRTATGACCCQARDAHAGGSRPTLLPLLHAAACCSK